MPRGVKAQPDPEPDEAPEPEPVPVTEPGAETAARFRVLSRVRYEADGNEYFAGPGETIDAAAAAQVDPDKVQAI